MKRHFFIYLFILFPILGIHSQEQLTLDDCIKLAKKNNQSIKAVNHQLSAAQFGHKSTKALFFPSFSITGNVVYSTIDGSYESGSGQLPVLGIDGTPTGHTAYFPGLNLGYDIDWLYGGGVKIEQPLYMGGKIIASNRMSKIGTLMAGQNKRLTEQEVIINTSEAYANVIKAASLQKVAHSYNELLNELLRNVESAKKQGMKSQNDVLKVKVKLNESLLNLRKSENALKLAKMNLCHYIGYSLTSDVEVISQLPNVSTIELGNIYNRPEYQLLQYKSEQAKQKITIARSEYMPKVGLVGQYGYMSSIKLNEERIMGNWNFLVGIQVSIPLFDFGYKYNQIRAAKAQYAQVKAEQENTNELLTLEMVRAYNNLDEAQIEYQLAQSSVKSAEENLRTSRLQYEKGIELLSDYLEAQTLWQQACNTEIETRNNCFIKLLEYKKTTGDF